MKDCSGFQKSSFSEEAELSEEFRKIMAMYPSQEYQKLKEQVGPLHFLITDNVFLYDVVNFFRFTACSRRERDNGGVLADFNVVELKQIKW